MNLIESIIVFTVIMMIMRYSVCAYIESHCLLLRREDK